MHSRALLGVLMWMALCLPNTSHAASPLAGFAPGSIWVSHGNTKAGSAVRLYTVTYNGGTTPIEGSISFLVDGTIVDSHSIQLEAGSSSLESVSWQAVEGTHTISARITDIYDATTHTALLSEHIETDRLHITVEPEEPKPTTHELIAPTNLALASTSPVISQLFSQVATLSENIRTTGLTYVTSLAQASSTDSVARVGSVLGAQREANDTTPTASSTQWTKHIARAATPVFAYPALFYPLFVGLLSFACWVLIKRLRFPSSRRK